MNNILAYHLSSDGVLSNRLSQFPGQDMASTLDWLLFSHTTICASCPKVVWDLSALVRFIGEGLPEVVRDQLALPPHRARWGNYKLFCIPDKLFSVGKNGSEVVLYDLSQYYPEDAEPSSLQGLQDKANMLQQVLLDLGVASPDTLSSPVAIFKKHNLLGDIEKSISTIFDFQGSTLEAFEIALQCTPREWTTNYQVGHFPELYSYDISSAYAYEAIRLLDLRDCTFSRVSNLDRPAFYGFLVGDFTVYPDHPLAFCSPFLAPRDDGTLVNFVGTKKDYPCLLSEVRALHRYGMGEFHLSSGWTISPTSGVRPHSPFNSLLSNLFTQRINDDKISSEVSSEMSALRSYFVKRVMTGIIGKLLESRRDKDGNVVEYGDLFNPIYHAMCTTGTRLKVFEFLVNNRITREELVHVGVDGVKSTRRLGFPGASPMGHWRQSGTAPAIVISPGAVLTPTRRFKKMDYIDLLTFCVEHPASKILGEDRNDPIRLDRIFLNQTRVFPQLPKTANDLIENRYLSDPIDFGD